MTGSTGCTVAFPWRECGPEEAAERLRSRPGLVWLDSALPFGRFGRWSIVASDPRWTVTVERGETRFDGQGGPRCVAGDPIDAFASAIEREQGAAGGPPAGDAPSDLPFTGGAIGYLGFELARYIERLPATAVDDAGTPLLAAGWYDAALVWDRVRGSGWLVGQPDAAEALRGRLERGRTPHAAADWPATTAANTRTAGAATVQELRVNMPRERYLAAVARAQQYIAAGDIYQVNLSQRFTVPVQDSGLDLYRRLREVSPAPFAAYLAVGGIEVLSSSPERLLLVDGGLLETRPVKGTRPRGSSAREDAALAAELLASEKDAAEHVMIVDLERNDLGRVSETGSVRVQEFAVLESFAQVHHLTSTVTGRRRSDAGLAELLRAVFPGGSITGAPKIRALEIIDELEPTTRGVYTGAIGYWSAHGRIDLNIAIRTITLKGGLAQMQVGGAIVHDSDPQEEYIETLDKARGMARALGVRLPDEHGDGVTAAGTAARAGRAAGG